MSRFTAIDLSGMSPPNIIEELSYEDILQVQKDDFQARMDAAGLDFDVSDLESDPAVKILEVAAAREVVLRARVNGAAKALLLAKSQKNDLEHLGSWFGVERLSTEQGDTVVYELDDRLRQRVHLAPQAFSTAGPHGAYLFHTLTAAPTVKNVGIYVPNEVPRRGSIVVLPLVDTGNGTPSEDVLDAIRSKLLEDDIRPLTDVVTVRAPKLYVRQINVTLTIKEGPDASVVLATANTALQAYAYERHKVATTLHLSGIYRAAHVAGVESVQINAPASDVDPGPDGAVYVEDIAVDHKVLKL